MSVGQGMGAAPLGGLITGNGTGEDFVDPILTRNQAQIQPWPYLELYEVETLGYGTLRYVHFQHPDAPGVPGELLFDGNTYKARKVTRGEIKKSDEIAQFPITVEDVGREFATAIDDPNEVGLNERFVRIHRIPYDYLDQPALAVTEQYRVQSGMAALGPDKITITVGLPSLVDIQVPTRIISRNRCWNEYTNRFDSLNDCRYPSDDFEEGTGQMLGRDDVFLAKPTSWPRGPEKRKFGWSTLNADIASLWQTGGTVSPSTGVERWTAAQSDDPNQKWGARSAIDQAATQDFTVIIDVTASMNDPATTIAAFPPAPVALLDSMIFGMRFQSSTLVVDVATAGAGTYTLVWQYWNGTSYAALQNVTDGTNGFKNAGTNTVTFDIPEDWVTSGSEAIYPMRALFINGTFTTIPLLRQAWSDPASHGMFMWKDLNGPFDVHTHLENLGTREERLHGLMFQDPTDPAEWFIWGQAETTAPAEVIRRRQHFAGVQNDEDFTTGDGSEQFRVTRVDDTFTLYVRPSDTGAWVQKDVVSWSAPQDLRIGLVVSSDKYETTTLVGARFRYLRFDSGGFPFCNRSESDCRLRENLHQFNAYKRITRQTTRG